jgi:hypothetical protein
MKVPLIPNVFQLEQDTHNQNEATIIKACVGAEKH